MSWINVLVCDDCWAKANNHWVYDQKPDALKAAKKDGWVRKRNKDGFTGDYCPVCAKIRGKR
jgi:hypothetical protein